VYPATDLARSRAFYEGLLGLTSATSVNVGDGFWVEYEIGPHTLAIGNEPFLKPSGDGPHLVLEVDDFVFTLVGPNNYPSSALVPINNTTAGSVQISRAGNEPEDGFTGYRAFGGVGVARWGDYSAAAVDSDGSIWMAIRIHTRSSPHRAYELEHLHHSLPTLIARFNSDGDGLK
jgi:hypothetical protein